MKTLKNIYNAIKRGKKARNMYIKRSTQRQLNCLRNICFHLCHNKIKLSDKLHKKLAIYKKDIRDLADKKKLKTAHGLKRRLIQKGGFLPILLPILTAILSSVGGKLVSKAIGV